MAIKSQATPKVKPSQSAPISLKEKPIVKKSSRLESKKRLLGRETPMARTTELAETPLAFPLSRVEVDLPLISPLRPERSPPRESHSVLLPTSGQFVAVADALSEPGKPIDQETFSSVLGFFDLAARPLSLHPARQHILQAMNCLAWAGAIRTQTWVREPTTYPVGAQWRALALHKDTITTLGQVSKMADNHGTRQETINLLTMLSLLNLPAQHQAITANEIGNHEIGLSLWSIARVISQDLILQNGKDTSSFWEYCQKSAPSISRLVEIAISHN